MNEKLKHPFVWLGLIALLHIPMVFTNYLRLWNYEHYQFFPFALGAFGWLVVSRRLKGTFNWAVQSTALLVLDLIFVVAGYYLNSPWLVCVGGIFFCLSVCFALRDTEVNSSLAYLVLLPLITIRLPLAMDMQVIQWLQKATTRVASDLLNCFGYLHLREGNVLEFSGKRFLVEEACSGVQSLFTLLFLAALIACGYRRKWLHAIFVLASAFCFAGLMNVVRVTSVSIAWAGFNVDWSSGWQHDLLGYIALVVAALLVFSADAFLNLIFSPVPDIPGGGVSSIFLNPLTTVWNWLFLVLDVEQATQPAVKSDAEDEGVRSRPGFFDLLIPRNLFSWIWNFLESWFLSRETKLLLTATPFLVAGLGGGGFMAWLQATSNKSLVETYEQAARDAYRADDVEERKIYLNNLVRLRPANTQYRFEFAMFLMENQQTEAALGQIEILTQKGPNDFAPARVWLARQALASEPRVKLSLAQAEDQLVAALSLQPKNIIAKETLAEVLLQKGQLKGAETQLLDVADENPRLLLPLVKLQKKLRRGDEQIQFHLQKARNFFEQELMKEPGSISNRIGLAESLMQSNRIEEAERVLAEGLVENDVPEIRSALAMVYSQLAEARIKTSPLNREVCGELVAKSLELAPENQAVLARAILLGEMGVSLDADSLKPATEILKSRESRSRDLEFLLVKALAASQQIDEAIDRLQSLVLEKPELRIIQVKLLRAANRTEEFDSLVETIISDAAQSESPTVVEDRLNAAEVLSVDSRFDESLQQLKAIEDEVKTSPQQSRRWKILFGQAMLANFDLKMKTGQFLDAEEAIGFLNQVLAKGASGNGVLERLVNLSFTDGKFAGPAEESLDRLLVSGSANFQIYNIIGGRALQKKQVSKARGYLERAYNMARADPMVLNNLAIALVRDEFTDPERALRLINEALEITPFQPDVLSTRAEVYVALERWEEARDDLEKALPKRPNSVQCHRLLALVWDQLGDSSLSEAHRRKVKELTDRLPAADTASGS